MAYWIASDSYISHITKNIAQFLSVLVVFHVIKSENKPAYKISVVAVVLLFPLFGGAFYLLCKTNLLWKSMYRRVGDIYEDSREYRRLNSADINEVTSECPEFINQIRYLDRHVHYPFFKNTEIKYFPLVEDMLDELCDCLEHARRYIFLEYFIVINEKCGEKLRKFLSARRQRAWT